MATIQSTAKTVSTALASEIVDTICEEFDYQIGNPQTKAQFAQEKLDMHLYGWIKSLVLTRRRKNAAIDTTTAGL